MACHSLRAGQWSPTGESQRVAATSGGSSRSVSSRQTSTAAASSSDTGTVRQRSPRRAAQLAIHWLGVSSSMDPSYCGCNQYGCLYSIIWPCSHPSQPQFPHDERHRARGVFGGVLAWRDDAVLRLLVALAAGVQDGNGASRVGGDGLFLSASEPLRQVPQLFAKPRLVVRTLREPTRADHSGGVPAAVNHRDWGLPENRVDDLADGAPHPLGTWGPGLPAPKAA